jgi:hypothetical protein
MEEPTHWRYSEQALFLLLLEQLNHEGKMEQVASLAANGRPNR